MIRTWSVWFLLLIPMLCIAEVPNYDIRKAQRDGISLVGMECHHKNMTLEIGLFFSRQSTGQAYRSVEYFGSGEVRSRNLFSADG